MMELKVKVYSGCKYDLASQKVKEHTYKDIVDFEVKKISDEEIYKEGYDEVDEHKEYAIMKFADGSIAMFRNSHVDIFRV